MTLCLLMAGICLICLGVRSFVKLCRVTKTCKESYSAVTTYKTWKASSYREEKEKHFEKAKCEPPFSRGKQILKLKAKK